MKSTRNLYTHSLPAQGCEAIIGGTIDSYFFPISVHLYIRFEVGDDALVVYMSGTRNIEMTLASPEFTGFLDIPAYVRQIQSDPLYQQHHHTIKAGEDLALWQKTYADEYSFAAFKKSALNYIDCFYAFSCEENYEEAGLPIFNETGNPVRHIDNIEVEHYCIDLHSEEGGVTLNYSQENKSFDRSLLVAMEDECDLVQPYITSNANLLSFFRRKRITQIVKSI